MEFVQNFPFICIILSLFSGPLSSILNGKKAKWWNTCVITVIGVMNVCVLAFVVRTGEPYVYRMGHFSAPWGNEIRVGILEAVMAVFFCVTMLLCMLGGIKEREEEIEESKQKLSETQESKWSVLDENMVEKATDLQNWDVEEKDEDNWDEDVDV